jgi:putative oxidoreductase
MIDDLTRLGLRATLGGYFVGHGAQKVFGALGGSGPEAAGEHFEEMGLAPGREMALLAGTTEMVGGTLTALGLGGPIGPLASGSVMAVAADDGAREFAAASA